MDSYTRYDCGRTNKRIKHTTARAVYGTARDCEKHLYRQGFGILAGLDPQRYILKGTTLYIASRLPVQEQPTSVPGGVCRLEPRSWLQGHMIICIKGILTARSHRETINLQHHNLPYTHTTRFSVASLNTLSIISSLPLLASCWPYSSRHIIPHNHKDTLTTINIPWLVNTATATVISMDIRNT